tara:strand:- start:58832 stop:59947 length:1116 start_codon:yes stop_codon:yes gene_type:complete
MGKLKIGILGDGQLAKYLVHAGEKLSLEIMALGLNPDECIAKSNHCTGDIFNANDVVKFAKSVDILTLENEFIPLDILELVADKLLPSFESFKLIENKLAEKKLAKKLSIAQVPYELISIDELNYSGSAFYKLAKGGYDGKGNFLVESFADFHKMYSWLEQSPYSSIIKEDILNFEKEVSITLVRNKKGQIVTYPIVDTIQKNHVCEFVSVPALIGNTIKDKVIQYSKKLLEAIDYIGVMSIEYFITQDGKVLYNECSPRPHNSAHYTMDACYTSQFENHIRSLIGEDLGLTDLKYPCASMFNLLGTQKGLNRLASITLANNESFLYDYGKREERPGRKMGHINLVGQDKTSLINFAKQYKEQLKSLGFTK